MIKVAVLWLINDRNQLLVCRRADHKKQDPGLWGPSVTGKLEPGETFAKARDREVEEELSLKPAQYGEPMHLFWRNFIHPDGELRRFSIYISRIDKLNAGKIVIDTNEVAEIGWKSIAELRNILLNKSNGKIVTSAYSLWENIFQNIEHQVL